MYYKGSLGFVFLHFVVVDFGIWESFKGVLWFVAIENA
jgi:hypothetical protein